MKPKIFAVVAMGKNRVIGNNGNLPWPEMQCDIERLKTYASHKPSIMGRLSYESPKQFLSEKYNLILTSHKIENLPHNCKTVKTKEEALKYYKNEKEICVLGGQKVFELFLPDITKIYLTIIDITVKGDAFFPELYENQWELTKKDTFIANKENPIDYEFLEYNRV